MKGYLDTDTQYSHHVTIQYNLCRERLVSYSRPAITIVKLRSSSNEEEGNLFGRDSTIITHFLNAESDSKTLEDSGLVERMGA